MARAIGQGTQIQYDRGGIVMSKVAPCLRSDGTTEEAATLYTSLFPNSRINGVSRSPADNPSTLDGAVLTVDFTLDGQAGRS